MLAVRYAALPFPVMTAQQQSGPYSLPPTQSALFRSPRPLLHVLEEAKVSVKALARGALLCLLEAPWRLRRRRCGLFDRSVLHASISMTTWKRAASAGRRNFAPCPAEELGQRIAG